MGAGMTNIRIEMGGSGFLAPAEAAAMLAAQNAGHQIVGAGGTSGGGICAALFAVYRDANKLMQIIKTLDWPAMMDWSNYLMDAWRIEDHSGICDPGPLYAFLHAHLGDVTFDQLDFDVKLTGTCLETQALQVFSKATTPNVKLADAARATSSIPFIYPPMEIDGKHYVDGGVTRNIPGTLWNDDGVPTYCVYLSGPHQATKYDDSVIQVASLTINALMAGQEAVDMIAAKERGVKLVKVDSGTLDAINPHMTDQQRAWLMDQGTKAMTAALA